MIEPVFHQAERLQGSAPPTPVEDLDSLPDEDLVRRYRDTRGPDAFTVMVHRHRPMVLRTCQRLTGNVHDAEDAAQSVFLALAQRPEIVRQSLVGCLHGLAQAAVSELRRSRRRRSEREELAARMKSLFARLRGRAQPMEHHELGEELDVALGQLPDRLQQAVILRYLEGHSQQEAAKRAGCTVATMGWRSMKGLERLRTILLRRGAVVTPAVLVGLLAAEARAAAKLSLAAAGHPATAAAVRLAAVLVKRSLVASALRKTVLVALLVVAAGGLGAGLLLRTLAAPTTPPTASPVASSSPATQRAETAALGLFDRTLDIGQPGKAGAANYADNIYRVQGGGTHIYGPADQFRFVCRPWTGDGAISAHVLFDPDQDARQVQAGVMLRESLAADSRHFALLLSSTESHIKYRTTANPGSDCVNTPLDVPGPHWVRLVRRGNTFSAYIRADGSPTWQLVKQIEVALDSNVYVGLAVTAHDNAQLATVTFDHVAVGREP